MKNLHTVELFCGTKSFSKVMQAHGHKTFTVDLKPKFEPNIVGDILQVVGADLPQKPDIVWASPPCTHFSVAAISHNWKYEGGVLTPKNEGAIEAQRIVQKTLGIIEDIRPKWYFIENPRGMLRKMPFMQDLHRVTIAYCQYGDDRQKPTDIWTNATWWKPRPVCKPGSPCHVAAPRGASTGTQGMKNAIEKGRIPPAVFEEILEQMPRD